MRRREFIAGLGAVALPSSPHAVFAQQPMPIVGYLSSRTQSEDGEFVELFREGLKTTGYDDGNNLTVEYRCAADLVSRKVAVIATFGGLPAASAAKVATDIIPVFFLTRRRPGRIRTRRQLEQTGRQPAAGVHHKGSNRCCTLPV